jgi:DNA (cytosine-5)-methyltransferase 1
MLTFNSFFSGIGGIDLGFERAGMKCVSQVEINDFCQKILTKQWPDVPKYKDIHHVGKHNLPKADVACGGFPCQPHSLAGKRNASADERDLWPEYYRVICETLPRWIVGENVPGLLSSENGRYFGGVLADLAACGYDVEWQVLSAAAFGAPHLRERLVIVAHANSIRLQESIFKQTVLAPAAKVSRWNGYIAGSSGNVLERWGWSLTSAFVGMADGLSSWVDRSRVTGNSVVPDMAEFVARLIIQAEACLTPHGADSLPGSVSAGLSAR